MTHPTDHAPQLFVVQESAARHAEAERRLASAAIDAANTGVAIAAPDGTLTRVNAAFLRLWGLTDFSEAVGRHATSFWVSPEKAEAVIHELFEKNEVVGELVAATRAGPRTMRLRSALIRSPDGSVEALVGTFNDVTDARRLEQRLIEAQRIARLGNWEMNRREDRFWWSEETYRIFGVDPATFEVSLEGFLGRVHPDDRAAVQASIARGVEAGRRQTIEHRVVLADGSTRWVEETATPWLDDEGAPIGVMGTSQDVTERHAAQEELRRLGDLLATVVANAPVGLHALDRDGVFTLSTGQNLQAAGLRPGELVGRSAFEVLGGVAGFREAFEGALGGEHTRLSGRFAGVDFEAVCAPLVGRGGAVEGVIAVALDVTEQLRLEAALEQARRIESVGLLAAGVAHDFNNVLSVILSAAHLIERQANLDGQAADDLRHILDAGSRGANLTRQLLAFAQQQPMTPRRLSLNELLRDLKPILRRLVGAPVTVRLVLEEDPPCLVADPTQLEQVVMNLVVNARDAMPGGGHLTIRTELRESGGGAHPTLEAGPHLALVVTDTGQGMPPEVAERVFEPFFTTKGAGRGTGLGLATVHGIVRQSGGDVEIRSAVGEGTTVTVLLPACPAATEGCAAVVVRPAPGPAQPGVLVLIVDDDPQLRYVAQRALEAEGLRVVTAVDGVDALDRLRQHRGEIGLVLTDVVMPQMSGVDFAQRAREEGIDEVPFLFMSGYTNGTTLRYGVEATGGTVVRKPFTPDSLLAAVRRILANRA